MAYKVSGSIQQPMTLTVLNSDGIAQETQAFSAGPWEINSLTCPSGTIIGFTEDDTIRGFGNTPFIEYDARPSVPWTDTFSGTLDSNMWQYWANDSNSQYCKWATVNGKSRSMVNSAANSNGVSSKFVLKGDFDIELGYTIITGPTTSYWELNFQLDFPTYGNYSEYMVRMKRSCNTTPTQQYVFEGFTGMQFSSNISATGNTTGKLRLVRSGSTFSGYYWNGSSWTQVGTTQDFGTTVGTYDLILHINLGTYSSYPVVICQYDYFKINSGGIGYKFIDRFTYPINHTKPNSDIYKPAPGHELPYTYNNKLRFDLSSIKLTSDVDLKEKLVGDFDVSVDCSILNVPDNYTWQFKLMVVNSDASYALRIGRFYVVSTGHCFRTESTVASIKNTYDAANTAVVSALRIRRSGTSIYTYYKTAQNSDQAWTLHRTTNGFTTDDLTCRLYGGIDSNATYASADFDNLRINNASNINNKLLVDIYPYIPTTIPEPNTNLLLHFDEATLVDSSYNKYPITISGSMMSAVTPKIGTNSLSFNGTSQYIRTDRNYGCGTNPFTIDCWFYCTTTSAYKPIIFMHGATGSNGSVVIYNKRTDRSDRMTIQYWNGTAWAYADSTFTPAQNTWYHLAVVRNGTALTLYVDGVNRASATISAGLNFDSDVFEIAYEGTTYYPGYIDEVRLSKGIARWTSNFTPSTSAYTADSYTELLLHGDEFPIIDSSTSPKTLINNGGTTLLSKFNGSAYFDGSTQYISVPDSEDWNFGTGDFTIDFWVNFSTLPLNDNYKCFYNQRVGTGNSADEVGIYLYNNAGTYVWKLHVDVGTVNRVMVSVNSAGLSTSVWYHITYVKNGNNYYMFQNGIQCGSTYTNSYSPLPNITDVLHIGNNKWTGGASQRFNGYIDELRISKGIARWTSNFTPPTSAYSA